MNREDFAAPREAAANYSLSPWERPARRSFLLRHGFGGRVREGGAGVRGAPRQHHPLPSPPYPRRAPPELRPSETRPPRTGPVPRSSPARPRSRAPVSRPGTTQTRFGRARPTPIAASPRYRPGPKPPVCCGEALRKPLRCRPATSRAGASREGTLLGAAEGEIGRS